MLATAYVDPFLAARQLPHRPVEGTSWPGHQVITHAVRGLPHRHDRLTYAWAATWARHHDAIEFRIQNLGQTLGVSWTPTEIAHSLDRLFHSLVQLDHARHPANEATLLTTFDHFALSSETGRGTIHFGSLFRRDLVPVDLELMQTLASTRALRTLDQYLWQTTTAHRHRDQLPLAISLETVLDELACPRTQPRKAAHALRKRQQCIRALRPDISHLIDGPHLILHPGGRDHA